MLAMRNDDTQEIEPKDPDAATFMPPINPFLTRRANQPRSLSLPFSGCSTGAVINRHLDGGTT